MTGVAISVGFPQKQFKRIPTSFSRTLSINYRHNNETYAVGRITTVAIDGKDVIRISLEVRKDETPLWYLNEILASAKGREILLVKGKRILARSGTIIKTSVQPDKGASEIVHPIEVIIVPLP